MLGENWKRSGVQLMALTLLCASAGWSQDGPKGNQFSLLLQTAVRTAGASRAGFDLVHFSIESPSEPQFHPTKGLDGKDAVPFLVGVLRGEPGWATDDPFRNPKGTYFHIARCYAALSLGAIGDPEALEPLIETVQRRDVPNGPPGDPRDDRQRYILADYAILALGYLGDSRAVGPIVGALPTLGQRYEYAAYALALLGDVRSAVPLVRHASNVGTLDYKVHRCLEDLTHAHFRVEYLSGRRTYRLADLPELGELSADKVYLRLWETWSSKGGEFAQAHAARFYVMWNRRNEKGHENSNAARSENRLFDEMVRGGVAALPYLMEQIEKGDGSLVPRVTKFVRPIREKRFGRSLPFPLSENATRSECLDWWHNNKDKYTVDFAMKTGSGQSP